MGLLFFFWSGVLVSSVESAAGLSDEFKVAMWWRLKESEN